MGIYYCKKHLESTIRCRLTYFRSSRPEVFCKKGVLRNFTKFTGKHLCQSLFFNKRETLAQVFSCEFCETLRTPFFIEPLWWLLLPFLTNVPIFTLWKHQKTFDFLLFSEYIKWEHWPEKNKYMWKLDWVTVNWNYISLI